MTSKKESLGPSRSLEDRSATYTMQNCKSNMM